MKLLFSLALRSLLRHRRRSLLTFLLLVFGSALLTFQSGMLKGFADQSYDNLIDFETGHLRLRHAAFDEDAPLAGETLLSNTGALRDRLAAFPFIRGIAERLVFQAEIEGAGDALPCLVTGIDPAHDREVFTLDAALTEGGLTTNGALLGAGLARQLDLATGDTACLSFRTGGGMINSVAFPVSGILASGDPQADNAGVYLDLALVRRLLKLEGATSITLRGADREQAAAWRAWLAPVFPEARIETWQEIGADIAAMDQVKRTGNNLIVVFLALIALVGLVNTVLLSVFEKRAEIGMLKALGMRDGEVLRLFVLEGVLLSGAGALAGILLGSLANLYFVVNGIDMAVFVGETSTAIGYRVSGIVHNRFDWAMILYSFPVTILAGALAALYPARCAVRLTPSEALRTI